MFAYFCVSAKFCHALLKPLPSLTQVLHAELKSVSALHAHDPDKNQDDIDRRSFLRAMAVSTLLQPSRASAYEQAYPVDLGFPEGDTSQSLETLRNERIARKKKSYEESMDFVKQKNPLSFRGPKDILTCSIWGGALWLLSGSRSNPLVTPIANLVYDEEKESWLKDRNDGLFASLPIPLFAILFPVFFSFGILADKVVLLLSDGSANVSLQLAGVALISGGFVELGRIASGEKRPTRDQFDRATQLRNEFAEFAESRLKQGGNCHRSDVVRAFRRYYAKYRREDSTAYPLSNIEIEKLLREWNAMQGYADMSSAGFYVGISINEQADVFVER